MVLRTLTWLAMVLVFVQISGCSDGATAGRAKTVPLTGKISLDGKPHGSVSLRFMPESAEGGARTAFAEVKPDGTFAATTYVTGDGLIPGKYEVRIGSESDNASTDPAKMMAAVVGAAIEPTTVDVPDTGLTDIDINFKSTTQSAGKAGGMLLGQ